MNKLSISGAITTQDLAPSGNAPTPLSFVQLPPANPAGTFAFEDDVTHVGVSVSNVYTAAGGLSANGTEDGKNWFVLGGYPFIDQVTGMASETIPSGQTGDYTINVVGLVAIRIDAQGAVTGEADIAINASTSVSAPRASLNPMLTGAQAASLPASVSDQVASAQPGRLVSITPLTAGSAATSIYDNASAGSGKLIYTLPATPTVGTPIALDIPIVNGITVKGAANTSGLLVKYD
jgi:hypothetical protein